MFFFFKQKTAYEMRISDWSSDVCSSDLAGRGEQRIENLAARIDLADHRVGIDFDPVERDMAREARVDQAARIGGQAFGVLRHREQSAAALGLRRSDAHVGDTSGSASSRERECPCV